MKQLLPIGLQDFGKLREDGYLYVDKTPFIHRLITRGKYFFLARPRRFGKSLTLSTIKEIFLGRKDLFEGLWIEDNWDWKQTHPVLHISFSSIGYNTSSLTQAIDRALDAEARRYGLVLEAATYDQKFKELLQKIAAAKGRVVLLIDEYDKPIIDYLDDMTQAKANQQVLRIFYSVIKDADPHIRFLLITGVSKFSKVSIFSELNNLKDITLHPDFTTLTGYTQAEVEHYFSDEVDHFAQVDNQDRETFLDRIRDWYNGYSWDGKNFVYNPFSTLSFFDTGQFQNFWFSTGTPTFLIKLLRERMDFNIGAVDVGQVAFDSFELDRIETVSLLFQTGYMTIKSVAAHDRVYRLDYPNQEVKESMLQYLLGAFSHGSAARSTPIVLHLRQAFLTDDLPQVITIINGLFKSIPSHIFLADKEAYYHSVVFLVFLYLGQFIEAEVHTSDGRIDAIVESETHTYLLEFKLDASADAALGQIQAKAYADKFRLTGKTLTAIGINFSSRKKAIEGWKTAIL